ncbi:hypothetical protein SUGI_0386540 [Cryptomeria japonica]|nr:hypothetical protein SUGI_0386540 [Cryptomeria japonica]
MSILSRCLRLCTANTVDYEVLGSESSNEKSLKKRCLVKNAQRLKKLLLKGVYKYETPKGCVAVCVGKDNEVTRFVIPIFLLNHPLFMDFLEDAQHEFGFVQEGILRVPCSPQEFVQTKNFILLCSEYSKRMVR